MENDDSKLSIVAAGVLTWPPKVKFEEDFDPKKIHPFTVIAYVHDDLYVREVAARSPDEAVSLAIQHKFPELNYEPWEFQVCCIFYGHPDMVMTECDGSWSWF